MKEVSMFFSTHPWFFPVLIGAILFTLLIIAVIRRIRGASRRARTVRAVFEGEGGVNGSVDVMDRGRIASGNTSVVIEHRIFTFREQDSGNTLRFTVSQDVPCRWEEGRTGKLTYAGSRFISFE